MGERDRGRVRPSASVLLRCDKDGSHRGFRLPRCDVPQFLRPDRGRARSEKQRHRDGAAVRCLAAMRNQGFGYAIIGGVGPAAYYAKTVGAIAIEGSEPGMYA